jgi:glycosyltransferase involved in cell wall biosynthesis
MKILFNCHLPFALAHGGAQIQIEQTLSTLEAAGIDAEPLRWWDDSQSGDIIHHVGRMPAELIRLAQQKNIKVVMAELLTEQGSRSPSQLRAQKIISGAVGLVMPRRFTAAFNWRSYRLADACIALTPWEAHLMSCLFGAPKERVHVVPNGVEDVFLDSAPAVRGPWLVCTATIVERKRVLELAETAVIARTPVWVIGKPYSDADPYAQRFFVLAKQHPQIIRYEGVIQDRAVLARIYREARGFVLLSGMESLSLSALEAAACECPLLLGDLPWARSAFGGHASYCPVVAPGRAAAFLRKFHDEAPSLKPPPRPASWPEIGRQLKAVYERVLAAPG